MSGLVWIMLALAILGAATSNQKQGPTQPSLGSGRLITAPQPAPSSEQPSQDFGEVGQVTPGMVTIDLVRMAFGEGEPIRAVVANGLDQIIFAEDRKTDCSILTLQMWRDGSWQQIVGCTQRRPAAWIAIGSGRVRRIVLDPNSLHLRRGSASAGFQEGQYRLSLLFQLDRLAGTPIVVHSRLFDVIR
jgi:hypothetical protein